VFGKGTGDFTDGFFYIGGHDVPGVTIGSLEGSGTVLLGANNLNVGSNNRSTTFSGLLTPGAGYSGGSLTKAGSGTLTLSKGNTYTGGTTIIQGAVVVKNTTGSATGSGVVQVNSGTLEGVGRIGGAVTVGTGSSSGAILLAGNSTTSPGTLTLNDSLTFQSLSTYKCALNRTTPKASKVSAFGVTINSNVPFTFIDHGTATLTAGTVFTVITNTSANPIFGRFSNLADGFTFTSNGTHFRANYKGGTGNDLTLTVVP
jgi:autotransporter-associated beta strand protein